MATKSMYFNGLNLSTTDSQKDQVIVDKKLLDKFFKHFEPASLDRVKNDLKLVVDSAQSLESLSEMVDEHLYMINVATKYNEAKIAANFEAVEA